MSNLPKTALAIHGGAGTLERSAMTPEKEAAYTEALRAALRAGDDVLQNGGDALTAVEHAVRSLEDCPLFNAGRGAVFTHSKTHELDASIMDGKTLAAGAVAGVSGIANPVQLARAVMEKSNHVLLAGNGALDFAKSIGFELKPEAYFFTEFRYNQLMQVIHEEGTFLDHSVSGDPNEKKFGTVGAVALDMH